MNLSPRQIPNAICVLRILLVAPIVWTLLEERYGIALTMIVIAGFSDALDGFLARKFNWRTWLGGLLDPAADKLLLVSVFVTLTWLGLVPVWFTALVVGRDLIIVVGILVHHIWIDPVQGEPTQVSKLNTVLQISFALLTITRAWLGWPPEIVLAVLVGGVLVTISISLLQYVRTGLRSARISAARPPGTESS